MPDDIDLEPHQYADRDPKSGKWRRPLGKRAARNWLILFVMFLIVLFVQREPGMSWQSFALTAFIAFGAGVLAQQWLRDVY